MQALAVLAEHMANLLDMIYHNEEKDKITSLIGSLLSNVFPFLRSHR